MIERLTRWCVPDGVMWSWRDQIHVFYDGLWIECRTSDRLRFMAIYGVLG